MQHHEIWTPCSQHISILFVKISAPSIELCVRTSLSKLGRIFYCGGHGDVVAFKGRAGFSQYKLNKWPAQTIGITKAGTDMTNGRKITTEAARCGQPNFRRRDRFFFPNCGTSAFERHYVSMATTIENAV